MVFKIASLIDIFGYLNELNLGLQSKNNNFLRHIDKILAFMKTLQHWSIQVVKGRMFDGSTIQDIITRQLKRYFSNDIREESVSRGCKILSKCIAQNCFFLLKMIQN